MEALIGLEPVRLAKFEHACIQAKFTVIAQHTTLQLIEQCLTSPPTQYRLYGRRFLQVRRPNQQYQSTEGTQNTQLTEKIQ